MRKTTAILLFVCLLWLSAGCDMLGGFGIAPAPPSAPAASLRAVSIYGDPAIVVGKPFTGDNASTELFSTLLDGAAKLDVLPAAPERLLLVEASYSDDSVTPYTILTEGSRYFLEQGENLLELNGAKVKDLLAHFSGEDYSSYYFYADLPSAGIDVNGEWRQLEPSEASYWYRTLDGSKVSVEPPLPNTALLPLALVSGDEPEIQLSLSPNSATAQVKHAGETVWSGAPEELAGFSPARSGDYELEVFADFTDPNGYYGGKVGWLIPLYYDLPVSFAVVGDDTFPGELVALRAYNVPEGVPVEFLSEIPVKTNFFDDGRGGKLALLPFPSNASTGEYLLTLRCGDVEQDFRVRLNDKQFEIQNLTIDSQTAAETVYSQQANYEYETTIAPLRPVADPEQYWSEGFVWPLPKQIFNTQFGMIRYVNNAPTSSRHNAIDLDGDTGDPVHATNAGRVLFAGFLQLTGNTVLIEHGYGLKSWYYHMSSLEVKTGDIALRDQKIGEVGSTGFSTGPHLHFGMSVNNVFINPQTIIESNLLTEAVTGESE